MIRHLVASAVALVLAVSCVAAQPASAQTAAQFAVQDATRTTRYLCETADGSGNLTGCLAVGAATSAAQSTGNGTLAAILTALGNPMQTGGSVSISNTPTVNIGSIGGGATASAQGTSNGFLQSLSSAQGSPTDPKSIATDTTSASETALLKGQIDRLQAIVTALGSPAQVGGKVDTVIVGTSADRGALVGTTSVTLMPANTSRRGFSIQVQSSSASCYMSGLTTATADYHGLLIGGSQPTYYETKDSHVGQGAITLICTAANTPVYSREW